MADKELIWEDKPLTAGIPVKSRESAEIVFDEPEEAEAVENTVCILCNTHLDSLAKRRVVKGDYSYWAHPKGFCSGDLPKTNYVPFPER